MFKSIALLTALVSFTVGGLTYSHQPMFSLIMVNVATEDVYILDYNLTKSDCERQQKAYTAQGYGLAWFTCDPQPKYSITCHPFRERLCSSSPTIMLAVLFKMDNYNA